MQTKQQKVTISLFDMSGRKLNVITNQTYDVGRIEIPFNCSHLIKGVYLLRIQTGNTI